MYNHNYRGGNNQRRNGGGQKRAGAHPIGQSYVWRVTWLDYRTWNRKYKAFRSRAAVLIFQAKIQSNANYGSVSMEKWHG